jgi:hypothetical protein
MKLFEDKIRTDVSPAKHIDNSFDFCDRNDFGRLFHLFWCDLKEIETGRGFKLAEKVLQKVP